MPNSMRWRTWITFAVLLQLLGNANWLLSANFIPADHPHIQYFGRWDRSDSLHPKHSWPGVSIFAEFSGKSIGVRMADDGHYYSETFPVTDIDNGRTGTKMEFSAMDSQSRGDLPRPE